ncbi:hypothetical protein [uncultured Ruegeria sp.]|uniref:head-tail joining protein n=1 Tax=uncultured Ruegeria sp. TaxID=259304 RepID=UPI00261F3EBD|nr:hypothetical protein [uncultured Ruegeria sp.]
MPHPDWEDLSDFFDPDEFADTANITRDNQVVGQILGVFDDPSQVAKLGEYEHDHHAPTFICPEVEAAIVQPGDVAEIDGTPYDVTKSPQADGTGLSKLILAEQNEYYDAGV